MAETWTCMENELAQRRADHVLLIDRVNELESNLRILRSLRASEGVQDMFCCGTSGELGHD